MPYTLSETLRQIDPYVQLSDGVTVATVAQRLMTINHLDLTEYAIGVDSEGRLLIYELDIRGYPIRPPIFIEQKPPLPIASPGWYANQNDFGLSASGTA